MFKIKWLEGEGKGFTDHLRPELFKEVGLITESEHVVIGPKGGRYTARCNVSVSPKTADLDYVEHQAFNIGEGMTLGVVRVHFTDASRAEITHVEWKDPNGDFERALVEII